MDYKQYIIVRKDLEMTCGKTCVQVSHASLDSYILSNPITRKAWHNEGQRKIVLHSVGGKSPFARWGMKAAIVL